MTNTFVCRVGLLALLVVVSSSCGDTTPPTTVIPTQPTPTTPAPTPTPPPVPRGPFPGAGTYEFVSPTPGRNVWPYTVDSRFFLKGDGTFVLRLGTFEYLGRYKYENDHITFDFDWNAQHEGAIGVFDGNRMTVTYNWYMMMGDFDDAVYQLK